MDHQEILSLLNEPNDSKFVTRKCNIVKDQSNANYDVGNEIIYTTEVLKSNLCGYNSAYILVRGGVAVTAAPATQTSFENCAPFTKCITKIDGTTIDDTEDLDLVMPVYNLIEYSSDYSFEYKAKLLGNTVALPAPNEASGILKNARIAVLLKYLSSFRRSLKVELRLKWTKCCVCCGKQS